MAKFSCLKAGIVLPLISILVVACGSSGVDGGGSVATIPQDLDADLFGTATENEVADLDRCYFDAVGEHLDESGNFVSEQTADASAYIECANTLGTASKFLRWSESDEPEPEPLEQSNLRVQMESVCLEGLGWETRQLPPDAEGFVGFEATNLNDANRDEFESDVQSCRAEVEGSLFGN